VAAFFGIPAPGTRAEPLSAPALFVLMSAFLVAMADRFARLKLAASTDPLTGLANRTVLFDRITLEIARAKRNGHPVALILFDLDHTLIDSDTSEAAAFEATLRESGVEDPARFLIEFQTINRELWAGVERGDLSPNEVRRTRFERFVASAGLDTDPAAMAETYVRGLGANGELLPGARGLLVSLAAVATLALVTNGIGEVQRARIARTDIERYFDAIVISGEVGVSKPGSEIFDVAFRALGEPPIESALMVGDNLSSDIIGGIRYGIDTCWYTADDTPTDLPITHRVSHLDQIREIVRGR